MQNATKKEFAETAKKTEINCQLAILKKNERYFCSILRVVFIDFLSDNTYTDKCHYMLV